MYLITWALVHESFFNFFSFQDVTIILVFKQISEFPCDWAEYSNQHVNVIATHSERYPSVLWQASYRIWINLIISIVLTIISIKNNCGEWWNRVISTKFSSCSFFLLFLQLHYGISWNGCIEWFTFWEKNVPEKAVSGGGRLCYEYLLSSEDSCWIRTTKRQFETCIKLCKSSCGQNNRN